MTGMRRSEPFSSSVTHSLSGGVADRPTNPPGLGVSHWPSNDVSRQVPGPSSELARDRLSQRPRSGGRAWRRCMIALTLARCSYDELSSLSSVL